MSSAFNIPAGFALVPLEPTGDMKRAANSAYQLDVMATAADLYRAMLSAAPPVDAVPGEPVAEVNNIGMLRATPHGTRVLKAGDKLYAVAPAAAAEPSEPDMRAVCDALGFDPTNHHNAAKCPYCRPDRERAASLVVSEEPEPMFYGRWHHGNGNLCCGSMRYFRADFDTNPAPDVREGIFDWVCTTMNAALDRWREQKRAADRVSAGEAQS